MEEREAGRRKRRENERSNGKKKIGERSKTNFFFFLNYIIYIKGKGGKFSLTIEKFFIVIMIQVVGISCVFI